MGIVNVPDSVTPLAQTFLTRNKGNFGYWLGLKAVRKDNKVQSYQWVDGVQLSFR